MPMIDTTHLLSGVTDGKLRGIVAQAIQYHPADRYQRIDELVTDVTTGRFDIP
jgi:hypothetical protein